MLLLINPHSGPGKAYTIFKNEIAPMLYEACIPYKAVVTGKVTLNAVNEHLFFILVQLASHRIFLKACETKP